MRGKLIVAVAGLLGLLSVAPAASAMQPVAESPDMPTPHVVVPPNVTAGVAVFDRQTGTFTEQLNVNTQFRSASVVKLLIVLDFLWDRGPAYDIPAADRTRLDVMLRSSDDSAASYYWSNRGQVQIINRMVPRLGLTGTAGPPSGYPGYWGYVALTAADTVRIYRYILDQAPAPVRDYIMGNLRAATRCGTDGFDQYFGIPSTYTKPWAIKQGWSGFSISGGCGSGVAADAVDLTSEALHTTGVVGTGDRSIIAVFTLHPNGTAYGTAYSKVGQLVRSLNVPGATKIAGSWFGTWGSGVRVRADTNTSSAVKATLPAGVQVQVSCQKAGQVVNVPPYTNEWWAYLPAYGGYMTNIYISSPDNKLPGVPDC